MMTTTHALISCGLLARQNSRARNWAAGLGAVLPDVPMVVLYATDRIVYGMSEQEIWDQRYWTDAWQIPVAITHSIPLVLIAFAAAHIYRSETVKVFALSVLLHIACDMPVHHDDAHMHFWPLSNWKFISPVSYWDERYYGSVVSKAELAIALAMILLLWRRFESRWVRTGLGLALAAFVAVPLYFGMTHHDG
jgi:LexA-binding, inner membrane-associated putative hydrolase